MPQMRKPRNRKYPTGADHPRWTGGERWKMCPVCGLTYTLRPKEPITFFRARKFCSRACSRIGQRYNRGPDHHNYRTDARRRSRGSKQHAWSSAVISRDGSRCRRCGATGVELHAHHIRSYRDHPELRYDVANGETLCYRCHWAEHTARVANAVNSVNPPPAQAEGNTEPSSQGNLLEGVTTRGRAFRRWIGHCDWCGAYISKRLSDVKGKPTHFCSGSCRSKWIRQKHGPIRRGSNASTSAAPERDDIV